MHCFKFVVLIFTFLNFIISNFRSNKSFFFVCDVLTLEHKIRNFRYVLKHSRQSQKKNENAIDKTNKTIRENKIVNDDVDKKTFQRVKHSFLFRQKCFFLFVTFSFQRKRFFSFMTFLFRQKRFFYL